MLLVLEQIPERTYASPQDLTDEVQRTYGATNSNGDIQSAAASAISDANKELISTMADPRRGDIGPGESSGQPNAGSSDG